MRQDKFFQELLRNWFQKWILNANAIIVMQQVLPFFSLSVVCMFASSPNNNPFLSQIILNEAPWFDVLKTLNL